MAIGRSRSVWVKSVMWAVVQVVTQSAVEEGRRRMSRRGCGQMVGRRGSSRRGNSDRGEPAACGRVRGVSRQWTQGVLGVCAAAAAKPVCLCVCVCVLRLSPELRSATRGDRRTHAGQRQEDGAEAHMRRQSHAEQNSSSRTDGRIDDGQIRRERSTHAQRQDCRTPTLPPRSSQHTEKYHRRLSPSFLLEEPTQTSSIISADHGI